MARRFWIHAAAVILIALAALVIIRVHSARGASRNDVSVSEGHRLAQAWCSGCHAIDSEMAGTANVAPDFAAVANLASTTELSLKVFLGTNHRNMPNLILRPAQSDDLVRYILSLKRN